MCLRSALSALVCASLALPTAGFAQVVLTIDDAREAARAHSWDRASALSRVEQTELLLDSATALLLPRVEAVASYTFNGQEVSFDFPNPIEPLVPYLSAVRDGLDPSLPDPNLFLAGGGEPTTVQYRHDVRGSLTASQSIFNPRAFPLRSQALRTVELAETAVDQVGEAVDQVVIDVYFGAAAAQRLTAIAERNLALAQLNTDRVVASFEEGVGNRFEANRARVDLSAAQRDVENARTTYRIAVEALATLLGRDPDFDVATPPEVQLPAFDDPATVVGDRAEFDLIDAQQQIDRLRVREIALQWLPVLTASVTGNLQRKSAFGGDVFTWSAGVSAYWELYTGGLRSAERRRREFDVAESDFRREQAIERSTSQVQRLQRAMEQEERNVTLAAEQVELARSNVEVTQYALEQGAATQLDVQYAQQQVYLSEIAQLNAEMSLLQRRWELAWELGLL